MKVIQEILSLLYSAGAIMFRTEDATWKHDLIETFLTCLLKQNSPERQSVPNCPLAGFPYIFL